MRILIVEDDFISQAFLQKLLAPYGLCELAAHGQEAVDAFRQALEQGRPYDLIALDIMMPVMDGHKALKEIRRLEAERGIHDARETKVIMTTALDDPKNVVEALYRGGATVYLTKPVERPRLEQALRQLGVADPKE